MPGIQGPRGSANGLWAAFALAACAGAFAWLLGWLAAGVSELDERCAHGMVGPGGDFRVERSSFPPGVRCVFADGSTVSAGDFFGWVLWVCVVVAAACAVLALIREFAGLRQERAVVRFGVLALVSLTVLAVLCAVVPTVLAPPGRDPLSTCPAFTTGVYERAFEVRRAVFPAQATCVYPSGVTHDLVPAWWGTMTWGALGAVAIALLGLVRAVRRHGWRPPGRRSLAAAARSARDT
ncbi:hypothetical protein ADK41_14535 [Streptomyces caelestis]|uniref:Uncharacterized protein n=2 Tax=Streptomyces TaxID=1883 RepID=A0A0N0S5P7_9ACTN|nr:MULTISPECIES: hypothetical protein [Streptomyces]KOT39101.1 hypothetical protein ADK41_14535 [Streptomyces caelestis]KOV27607.1 hypothetical protein ADK58_13015 [Streptomyces sp. XY152]